MYLSYIRSSSLGNYNFCPTQYFLTYNLGMKSLGNTKANKGSTCHKVLECLALCKKYIQDNPNCETVVIDDDAIGHFECSVKSLYEVKELTFREINDINKSRINKSTYKYDCMIPSNHTRVGSEVVEDLIKRACDYYCKYEINNKFTPVDTKDIQNFVWIPLELFDRTFDPRNQNIFSPELAFELDVDLEFAYSTYTLKGEEISTGLKIKGTMDLLVQESDTCLSIVDYKSGQRLDWATSKIKDYEYLQSDKQLLLYYYAARKKFPQFKDILITIFFLRDGGPYTLSFSDADLIKAEKMLEEHFNEVIADESPRMVHPQQRDFKCQKLCHFYKNSLPDTDDNICKHIHKELRAKGMEKVIDEYIQPGFSISYYQNPGA